MLGQPLVANMLSSAQYSKEN